MSNEFVCRVCGNSYDTKVQHERHRHEGVRNMKRAEEAEWPRISPGRNYIWSDEDSDKFTRICRDEDGLNLPLQLIHDNYFPEKDLKQISDRRILIRKSLEGQRAGRGCK